MTRNYSKLGWLALILRKISTMYRAPPPFTYLDEQLGFSEIPPTYCTILSKMELLTLHLYYICFQNARPKCNIG